jgi:hypothetical protein
MPAPVLQGKEGMGAEKVTIFKHRELMDLISDDYLPSVPRAYDW